MIACSSGEVWRLAGDDVFASDANARTPSAAACVVAVRLLRMIAVSVLTRVLAHPFRRSSEVGSQAATVRARNGSPPSTSH